MVKALREAEIGEEALRLGEGLFSFPPRYERRHGHILQGRELREQLMKLEYESNVEVAEFRQFAVFEAKEVGVVKEHASGIGAVESARYLKQRGLPGARRPHDCHYLTFRDCEGNVVEHGERAERLGYVFDFNHWEGCSVNDFNVLKDLNVLKDFKDFRDFKEAFSHPGQGSDHVVGEINSEYGRNCGECAVGGAFVGRLHLDE